MSGPAGRVARAQTAMAQHGFGALVVTSPTDIAAFTGFRTEFFESPTRPWFVVVPAGGDAIAVIPAIGEPLMSRSGVGDIRTWPSPRPDDEGVSLLSDVLAEVGGPVAMPMQPGTSLAMSLRDWLTLRERFDWRDDGGIVRDLRMVKDEDEIDGLRTVCAIATRAFARLPQVVRPGMGLADVFRRYRILALEEGADRVAYLAGGCGTDGYEDVISPATDVPIAAGEVLMLDTGTVRDGWYSDFCRNYAVGPATPTALAAQSRLIEATAAAAAMARPGVSCREVHAVMEAICGPSFGGRLGHGLGRQLTEPPSFAAHDDTVLQAGMVMTFEPVVQTGDDRVMVHEEVVVIREGGVEWLSGPPAEHMETIA